ncbi:MAG TPA: AMP-binding protein [Syntrophales bacterium]|nr:AMP-binding protein [Syntrophales bacterium]
MNLVTLADDNLDRFGEYPFVIFEGKPFTNTEILRDANRLASGLKTLGIGRGDRVAVLLPNSPEVIVGYQGILRCGAAIVPIIPSVGAVELGHILNDCEARALVTGPEILQAHRAVLASATSLKHLLVTGDTPPPGTISFRSLTAAVPENVGKTDLRETDLAVILYTAGTTWNPKGVILTHANLYSNAVNAARAHGTKASDVTLVALPLSHSFGITTMNKAYQYGNLHVLMRRFQAEEAFALIERHRVTDFPGVPAMFMMMLGSPVAGKYDLSSLKKCLAGSAPFPLPALRRFEETFRCTVYPAYGLSEASPAVSTNYQGRPVKPDSVGQPIPSVKVRIVDDRDQDVPAGEVGELLVRGPNVAAGYLNLPEETARAFRDGWLYTGDMARMDGDGYLYIVERKKDLIIRGGFNIYPRDIEEVLHGHPAVRDAVAVGMPDPVVGEEAVVYVELREGESATEESLLRHCRDHLSPHKRPLRVTIVECLPRNPMGKILRRELRRMAASGEDSPVRKGSAAVGTGGPPPGEIRTCRDSRPREKQRKDKEKYPMRTNETGKKVLVLLGSPRKKGNTAILAAEIARGAASKGAEVETVYLHGQKISPCQGCMACQKKNAKRCAIDDDMQAIYPKLLAADAWVIASPVYWFTMTAQTKLWMDRCFALPAYGKDPFRGKRIAVAMAYGGEDPFDSGAVNALRAFQDAYAYVEANLVGMVYGSAMEAGKIRADEKVMKEARALGMKLAAP